jgi:hypothetical protein
MGIAALHPSYDCRVIARSESVEAIQRVAVLDRFACARDDAKASLHSAITPSTNPSGSPQNSRMTLKWSVCSTVIGSSPYLLSRKSVALG